MTKHTLHILLLTSLAVAACGSDGDDAKPSADKPATTKPAAERSAAPYGTYVRRVTRKDLARTQSQRDEYGPNQHLPPAGGYRLVIAEGAAQDVLKATDPGDFTVGMDISAAKGVLDLTSYVDPAKAAFCGAEVPAKASYSFDAKGSTLVLRPEKADPCADRDSILTGTWQKR
jgi:hypothetical protein